MKKKIKLGITDLSFHRVTAALVAYTIEQMGFEVERIYVPHQENFKNLKEGVVDLLTSAWLPSSHGIYKSDVETTSPLLELGLHYEPYALWGVPDYVSEESVSQVSDLLKPDVLLRMKKEIQGINSGAGITRFSLKMMDEYGLYKAGYEFYTGSEEDCFTAFENAVAKKEWLIVPLWKPQFLHYKYNIRALKEPKGLLGIMDRAVLLLREDRRGLFTQEQLNKLDDLRFSNDVIARLDYKVSREGANVDEVARDFLQFLN